MRLRCMALLPAHCAPPAFTGALQAAQHASYDRAHSAREVGRSAQRQLSQEHLAAKFRAAQGYQVLNLPRLQPNTNNEEAFTIDSGERQFEHYSIEQALKRRPALGNDVLARQVQRLRPAPDTAGSSDAWQADLSRPRQPLAVDRTEATMSLLPRPAPDTQAGRLPCAPYAARI